MDSKIFKKRGRKKKEVISSDSNNITISMNEETPIFPSAIQNIESEHIENAASDIKTEKEENTSKKRGRKPKGGKLILKNIESSAKSDIIPNIILHLKCSLSDLNDYNMKLDRLVTNELKYNPEVPPEIETYNSKDPAHSFSNYGVNDTQPSVNAESNTNNTINNNNQNYAYFDSSNVKSSHVVTTTTTNNICQLCNKSTEVETNDEEDGDLNIKDINQKLKKLKINLYKNTLQDKKSACFWCTYDYDNQSCYIPKYEMDDKIYGYGSFCRPECAVAYLMKENLDDSTKFERYHLLNHIYSKVYEYKKNIKPAPNPYYLLEKFFGNLSIQEYRKLLKTEHLLTIIEKPLSRILPELFEDNDNFILSIYGNSTKQTNPNANMYKVKRQSEKQAGPSKNSIMKEKFGLASN